MQPQLSPFLSIRCIYICPLQAGRSSKRQLVLFPGGTERHVKIKTCSVSFPTIITVHYSALSGSVDLIDSPCFLGCSRGH